MQLSLLTLSFLTSVTVCTMLQAAQKEANKVISITAKVGEIISLRVISHDQWSSGFYIVTKQPDPAILEFVKEVDEKRVDGGGVLVVKYKALKPGATDLELLSRGSRPGIGGKHESHTVIVK